MTNTSMRRRVGLLGVVSGILCAGCATQPDAPKSLATDSRTENVLLQPVGDVDTACHSLSSRGVRCVFPNETWTPQDASNGGLPLIFSDLPWFDASRAPRVGGLLLLSERRSPGGNPYYVAMARIYKFDFSGGGAAIPDSSYYDEVWSAVGARLPYASERSAETGRFVERLDDQMAAAKREELKKEAAAAAEKKRQADDAAYKASPAYKKAQADKRVANCRNQIALARAAIVRDERVAQISGYENKLLRESAAQTIVNCQDTIARGGY
ncbi:putative lipoprotein [Burkholderia cepacia]|nr:putative lipoprotein [Burkholderia cepacia]KGC01160.1 putative lipoprotein [Burkholderia cepacia]